MTMVETGLPGRPKTRVLRQRPKTVGLPGRIATASKKNSAPIAFQDGLDQVVLAHRDAAGEDQDVLAQALLDFCGEIVDTIEGVTKRNGFASSETNLRREGNGVAVANVKRAGSFGDGYDFVAGGEDGDARLFVADNG